MPNHLRCYSGNLAFITKFVHTKQKIIDLPQISMYKVMFIIFILIIYKVILSRDIVNCKYYIITYNNNNEIIKILQFG